MSEWALVRPQRSGKVCFGGVRTFQFFYLDTISMTFSIFKFLAVTIGSYMFSSACLATSSLSLLLRTLCKVCTASHPHYQLWTESMCLPASVTWGYFGVLGSTFLSWLRRALPFFGYLFCLKIICWLFSYYFWLFISNFWLFFSYFLVILLLSFVYFLFTLHRGLVLQLNRLGNLKNKCYAIRF